MANKTSIHLRSNKFLTSKALVMSFMATAVI